MASYSSHEHATPHASDGCFLNYVVLNDLVKFKCFFFHKLPYELQKINFIIFRQFSTWLKLKFMDLKNLIEENAMLLFAFFVWKNNVFINITKISNLILK